MSEERRRDGLSQAMGAMRAEWRAEEEEITKAAYEQWRHGRSLAETLAACAARGDAVCATFTTATFRGPVTEVGPDRFQIAAAPGPVDVALGADLVLGIDPGAGGAGAPAGSGASMRARLLEHETAGATVVLGTATAELRGRLVVGADHVVVSQAGLDRIVPLDAIAWARAEADTPGGAS